ncbi:MAG TPA: hypothetical protein VKI65_20710 [Gemmataceae bacterium]|nr:hypothetical protein [Gemmataceae bacterium]
MATGGLLLVRAVRDDAYIASMHMIGGALARKYFAQGKSIHVFDPGIDLDALERQVWTAGAYQGRIGAGPRSLFERFVWHAPTPIGKRLQRGRPDLMLRWVEIKGRMVRADWVYHLDPRSRPAS